MKLSVIVPVYNVEAYLAECLECLLDQDLDAADYEIVLVNDGSADDSKRIAEQYAERYAHIVLFSQKNSGQSVARNVGVSKAKGDFLYFIDSDDYIERKSLGKILAFMERNDLDFCGFASKRTPDRNASGVPDWRGLEKEPEVLTGLQLIAEYGYNNGVWWYIFKKDILERNGIFFEPETRVEDGPFTTNLLIHTDRAVFLPVQLYYYYINRHSIIETTDRTICQKISEGMLVAVKRFTPLIETAKERGANAAVLRRLKIRQESYVFFFVLREIRIGTPFEKIKERLLTIRKETSAWPLVLFSKEEYGELRFKVLTTVVNHLFLLRIACAVYNFLKPLFLRAGPEERLPPS
ncbi:MAG: glycosyltransferase [Synergistaceae bacterium]|jgi:glycosyltransferase involved in cell wall biosynthesis|nr:glycosyltransferase [Synergistaceae bacterium]